jgi:signal transduction histidine kinase
MSRSTRRVFAWLAVSLVLGVGSIVGQHLGLCGLMGGVCLITLAHLGSASVLVGAAAPSAVDLVAPAVKAKAKAADPGGGLAHDVNHLVGLIADYADEVHERVLQCEPRGCWSEDVTRQVIRDSASLVACTERVGALTGRLLGAGGDIPRPERLDLNRLVTGLEPLLGRESRGRVRLDDRLDGELWPVVADRVGLEQVLMNLCGNAREAMGDGGVISIRTENVVVDHRMAVPATGFGPGPGLTAGPYVCLTVADTGPGMPADVLARVAEPGFSTKAPGRNRGLGLTTVVHLLGGMGGDLRLWSEPGRGTEARAYLPADPPTVASADTDGG